jgi:hypothetical protein
MVLTNQKLGLYQKWLKRKFEVIETIYYNNIDELSRFIKDLEIADDLVPMDFTLTEYSFVEQWQNGIISSAEVYRVMSIMDIETAAKAKITKRLTNYMIDNEILAKHIKPTIEELNKTCMDLMVEYLNIMKRAFKKMAELDEKQIQVTWVQQFFKAGEADQIIHEEMTLNQTVRHIASFIDKSAGQRFRLKDQIIVFDEEMGFDDRAVHWIFAPRQYIELLRVLFNVKDELGNDEIEFLKTLIKDVE